MENNNILTLAEIDVSDNKDKSGYIYIMSSHYTKLWEKEECSEEELCHGYRIFKIGKAQDVNTRMRGFTTSYKCLTVEYDSTCCIDYHKAENIIHKHLKHSRLEHNREFFKVVLEETKSVIEEVIHSINTNPNYCFVAKEEFKVEHEYAKKVRSNIDYDGQYEHILNSKYKLEEHLNIISFFTDINVPHSKKTQRKINIVKEIEQAYSISVTSITSNDRNNENIVIPDNLYETIIKEFRCRFAKPDTFYKMKQLYVRLIKHITVNEMITKKRIDSRTDGMRGLYVYKFNELILNYHLHLNDLALESNID